jgi:hypothetical protein
MNRSNFHGNLGPKQRHILAATWIHYNGTEPPHEVMLQLKDIVSASEVKINALFGSKANPNTPFTFIFTIVNEITGNNESCATVFFDSGRGPYLILIKGVTFWQFLFR